MKGQAGASLSRITDALPATLLLSYLLLSEPPATLLLFASALVFHEWGHVTAFLLLGIGRPTLMPEGVGVRLLPARPLLPREDFIVTAAGPLCNILFALAAIRLGSGPFCLLLATVHLIFGIGNLLPFGGCDGERCLSLLLGGIFPRKFQKITATVSEFFLSFFFLVSLFLYYLTGNGICGIFFTLFLLFEEQKPCGNVF